MPGHFELYYDIQGRSYWEDEFDQSVSEGGILFAFGGGLYTQEQLKQMSSSWSVWYNINGIRYSKSLFSSTLLNIDTSLNSTRSIAGNTYTRQQLQKIVDKFESLTTNPSDTSPQQRDSAQELDGNRSETTQTTFSTGGMDTPRPQEDEDEDDGEEDELVAKVLANLHAKTEAIKRRRKVAAEVEKLRKLLAEKEADLMECDRVMALEVEQVKAD